jgi:hypothetical protein
MNHGLTIETINLKNGHTLYLNYEIRFGMDTYAIYLDMTEMSTWMAVEMAKTKIRLYADKLNSIMQEG